MGKNLQNIIAYCKKEGYLKFSDGILGDLSNIDDKDSILLIQDNKENPYASISKIINEYNTLGMIDAKNRAYKIGKKVMAFLAIAIFFIFCTTLYSTLNVGFN